MRLPFFADPSAHTMKFSDSHEILFTCSYDRDIRVWKFDSMSEMSRLKLLHGHRSMVNNIEIIKDSYFLFSVDDLGEIRCWDIRTLSCV